MENLTPEERWWRLIASDYLSTGSKRDVGDGIYVVTSPIFLECVLFGFEALRTDFMLLSNAVVKKLGNVLIVVYVNHINMKSGLLHSVKLKLGDQRLHRELLTRGTNANRKATMHPRHEPKTYRPNVKVFFDTETMQQWVALESLYVRVMLRFGIPLSYQVNQSTDFVAFVSCETRMKEAIELGLPFQTVSGLFELIRGLTRAALVLVTNRRCSTLNRLLQEAHQRGTETHVVFTGPPKSAVEWSLTDSNSTSLTHIDNLERCEG
mmetsp:Transcript_10403/g.11852  ORF Transcript_10403/g.11852 Transcript_10403/m.11852 type:complete len:265 (-) Transcript_10403:342-1136(-)